MDEKTIRSLADRALALLTSAPPSDAWEQPWDLMRDRSDGDEVRKIRAVESVLSRLKPTRTATKTGPSYDWGTDEINIPPSVCYRACRNGETATQAYYHSVFHELTHWTGHFSRLRRRPGLAGQAYAREEMVAQTSAVMLTAHFNVAPTDPSRHIAYFQGWLARAGDRKAALQFARVEAERAVAYIMSNQSEAS